MDKLTTPLRGAWWTGRFIKSVRSRTRL